MRNHVKEIKKKKQKPFDKLLILGTLPHDIGVYTPILPQLQMFRSKITSYSEFTLQPTFLAKVIK